ncbi:hypothetical protein ACIGPN_30345 [Streptomyces afghaniensis]|uniref:hypothetical protein n=1 Tax=Streptomyces afghaniensis TaxID=66865 RepID=UPI0037D3FE47
MEKKDWVAAWIGIAGILASLGLGISNAISQNNSEKEQKKAAENIRTLQAKATVVGISWSVDDPVDTHRIVVENRSKGSLHNALIQLRETQSQTSRVTQFLWVGKVANCMRAKYTVQDGVQLSIENFNRGSFVFETDTGFWSRPYSSGLVFFDGPPPDVTDTAKEISNWTNRKDETIPGCE